MALDRVRRCDIPQIAVGENMQLTGRLVEEQVQRSSARAGVHQRVLEGRATTKGRLASGAYLLRISALEESGRVAARREHRFVVTP